MTEAVTVGATLSRVAAMLGRAGVEKPRLDSGLLLGHVLALDRGRLLARAERPVPTRALAHVMALARRRERREPLAHILGEREFWSLPIRVTADTLVPRPDSETVVEAALHAVPSRNAPLRILDLGTGSGCLLLALLSELPNAAGIGVDACPRAGAVAAANARRLGLSDRADIRRGDWGSGLRGAFDLIVANPPYVPRADLGGLEPEVGNEPRRALDGGVDGLAGHRALMPHVARLLAPRGAAVLELGCGQADAVAALLAGAGLAVTARRRDLAGIERCVVATRDSASRQKCLGFRRRAD